jgi:hypothetical protein
MKKYFDMNYRGTDYPAEERRRQAGIIVKPTNPSKSQAAPKKEPVGIHLHLLFLIHSSKKTFGSRFDCSSFQGKHQASPHIFRYVLDMFEVDSSS